MTRIAFLGLVSHWRRQPLQLATLVLGLALATALWSAVQAINGQARASYAQAARQLAADQLASLSPVAGSIPLATYVGLRRAGWQVTPVIEGRARIGGRWVTVMGIDFLGHPVAPQLASELEDEADDDPGAERPRRTPAQVLGAPGRLFLHPDTAARIDAASAPAPLITTRRLPVGIVLTDIGAAERILDRPGQISRLLVLPDQARDLPALSDLVPDLTYGAPQNDAGVSRLTDSFHLNLTAFGLLAFAVGLFIVHGTVGLAFEQRRAMFRTLRALGVPLRLLGRLLLAELLTLALIAGSIGLVLGYLIAAALLPDVSATLRGLYGAPVGNDGLTLRPLWVVSGLGMALIGALLAGAQGLWRLRRLPILSLTGAQGWQRSAVADTRIMALSGAGLIVAGGLCLLLFDGLWAGFALLGGLMLGAALLLPPALALLIRAIRWRARGVLAQWVWADLHSQLSGLSLALMALLLALATNVGVGTMVSSFRLTFENWLDQRLAAELYVTARDDDQGRRIAAWLTPRSDAVLPIRYAQGRLDGQPARIYGIVDHATYRDHWPLIAALPQVWSRLHAGQAVLINEQLARRADLWPGDPLTLAPGWQVPVAGVYSDYGNPHGQAIVSLPALLQQFGPVTEQQFGIRIPPARAPDLAQALRAAFDLPAGAVVDQAAIKRQSLSLFEKTFVVTAALNVLTLGVASFAILTSLLTLWTLRLPQLAPVWALGLTRRRLAGLELARSVALAAMTALLALPLGLVLAWVLLAVINVEAFGWRLPMHLFPLDWLRLAVLAVLAGAVAAALPARRLQRTPPADLLKVFANER